MNAATLFRRAALLQVLLALGAFAAADRNEWFLIAGGIMTVASSYITEGPRGRHLPNWVIGPGVVLAAAWGGLNVARNPEPAAVGSIVGAVVLAILMLKLYGKKGPSDWRQILALTVVIVIDAALNSMELLAGILVIAYAGIAVASAMLHQMYAGLLVSEWERAQVLGVEPQGEMVVRGGRAMALQAASLPVSGRGAARHLRWLLVASCCGALLMSMVVFVLFPREPSAGSRWSGSARQAGFAQVLRLQSGEKINVGSREVCTVRMLDPQGKPDQFAGSLHLRGAVLDYYNPQERTWSATGPQRNRSLIHTPGKGEWVYFARDAGQERTNVWTQVVQMRTLATEHFFSQWLPLGIALGEERDIDINTQTAAITDKRIGRGSFPSTYAIKVQPFPGPQIVRSVCPVGNSVAPISFPVPRVVEVAESLLASANLTGLPTEAEMSADPALRYERSRRIARWFNDYLRSTDFAYTTDLSRFRMRTDEDPNVTFLTRHKFGHCEFFASALAALCRSVGVDARVVTGFAVSEYDGLRQQYSVRESNAHAWVEVRTGEWQWTTFDPSPSASLLEAQNASRSWVDQFRWVLDPLEFMWQSRVVNFDSGSQSELAESLRQRMEGSLRGTAEWVSDAAARVNYAFMLGPAGYIWLGIVGLLVAVALIAIWVLARRDRQVRTQLGVRHARAAVRARLGRDAGFYLDALDVLRRHGLGKPHWKTPQAYAADLGRLAGPDAASAFAAVVSRFYAVRYAGQRPSRAARNSDAALVLDLRAALAGRYTSQSRDAGPLR